MIDWFHSFFKNRTITLTINNQIINFFPVPVELSQGSPLFFILYLFYNAELLEKCNQSRKKAIILGFADDVNILAYDTNTEANCRTLKSLHGACAEWAEKHGTTFSPSKYELIHLARNPKKFNMTAIVKIGDVVVQAKSDIRILDLQIDTKLKWDLHVKKIQTKMTKQKLTLSKLTTFIWRTSLAKFKIVYSAVIKSAIFYASSIWRSPCETSRHSKSIDKKLKVIQNECLRVMSEAFRITAIKMLKVETQIESIGIYLNKLQAKTRLRMTMNGFKQRSETTCEKIRQKLKANKRRRRQTGNTPGKIKHKWIDNIILLDTQLMNRDETSMTFWLCNAARIDQQNEEMNAAWLIKKQTKKFKSFFKYK